MKYSIEVYEDHAIVNGFLPSDVLKFLTILLKKEGLNYVTHNGNKSGFKFVRKDDN